MKLYSDAGSGNRLKAGLAAGLISAAFLIGASPANACRSHRYWPSEPNDPRIVRGMIKVIATVESEFVSQEEFKGAISGPRRSVIYGIKVTGGFGDMALLGRQMLVFAHAALCEAPHPGLNMIGKDLFLVLAPRLDGLPDIVGFGPVPGR